MDPVRSLCWDAFRMDIAESQCVAGSISEANRYQSQLVVHVTMFLLFFHFCSLAQRLLHEADREHSVVRTYLGHSSRTTSRLDNGFGKPRVIVARQVAHLFRDLCAGCSLPASGRYPPSGRLEAPIPSGLSIYGGITVSGRAQNPDEFGSVRKHTVFRQPGFRAHSSYHHFRPEPQVGQGRTQ